MSDAPEPVHNPLRGSPALARASASALQDLFEAAEQRHYVAGDVLIRQGEPGDGLMVLLDGRAHALLRSRDGNHLLGEFRNGDVFGEMALVTREARSADVIADSDVHALFIPAREFDRLASRHLELGGVLAPDLRSSRPGNPRWVRRQEGRGLPDSSLPGTRWHVGRVSSSRRADG